MVLLVSLLLCWPSLERSDAMDVERLISSFHYVAAIWDASDLKHNARLQISLKLIDISKSLYVNIDLNFFCYQNMSINYFLN